MKQRIDHSNYEAWLLDRLEGSLSPEQERELSAFLLLHPELDPGPLELPTIGEQETQLGTLDKEALKRRLPPVAQVAPLNVEDHLIARLENDLSQEQLEALRSFLLHHPAYQRVERLYALTKLVPEAMTFAGKHELVRELPPTGLPTRFNLDDFLVAKLEGQLTAAQETALVAYLRQHPSADRAWELMRATKVEPIAITFPLKQELKKGGRVIAIGAAHWSVRLAAAASITLLLGIAWWLWLRPTVPGQQIAAGERSNAPVVEVAPYAESTEGIAKEPSSMQPEEAAQPNDSVNAAPQRVEGPKVPAQPIPLDNEEPLPLAQSPPTEPVTPQQVIASQQVLVPTVSPAPEQPFADANVALPQSEAGNSVGRLIAATLRERVLDAPAQDTRPLDGNDAIAAVDRGLKVIGGDHAGLVVSRDETGRGRGFNLRLGRNLAISASQ